MHDGSHWRIKPPRLRSFNLLTMVALMMFIIYNVFKLQADYLDDPSDPQFVKEPDHYTEPWNDGADVNSDRTIEMRLLTESDNPPVQQLDCPRLPADQSLNVQVYGLGFPLRLLIH
jgi:hypothetical protein